MVRKATQRRRQRRPAVQVRARDILSQVALLLSKHWLGLLLVALPFALTSVIVERVAMNAYPHVIHDMRAASMLAFYATTVIAYWAMAAIAVFAWPHVQPRATAISKLFKVRHGLTACALALVAPLGVFAGLAVAIIPGIIISLSWCVAPAAAALRGESVRGALRLSAQLTWGSRKSLFYVFAAAYVAVVALSCVSATLMGRSVSDALFDTSPPPTPQVLIDGLLQLLQLAFNGTVSAVFFAAALKDERADLRA